MCLKEKGVGGREKVIKDKDWSANTKEDDVEKEGIPDKTTVEQTGQM